MAINISAIEERIEAMVTAGKLTEDEGHKLKEEAYAASHDGRLPEDVEKLTRDPRKGDEVKLSDRELLISALLATGSTQLEAYKAAAATDLGTQAEIIKAEKVRLQNLADRRATEVYEQSPEGKRERGEALAAARAEEAKLVAPARELLLEQGLSQADVDQLAQNPGELLVMAGLREAPERKRPSESRMIPTDLDATARQAGEEIAAIAAAESAESGESA